MTLVEVLVSFLVLMIVLVPVSTLLANVVGQAATARVRLTALSLAEQYIELLNNQGPPTNASSAPTLTHTIKETAAPVKKSGVSYTVYARFSWTTAEGGTVSLCNSGTQPKVMNLQVKVTWANGRHLVKDTTVINYPAPDESRRGFIAVTVEGSPAGAEPADTAAHAFSTRVEAVWVKVHRAKATTAETPTPATTTETFHPGPTGCVFEPVIPGSYLVKVTQPTSGTWNNTWVANADEAQTQTQYASVTASLATNMTFQYDEGAIVNVTYPSITASDGGVTCPHDGSVLCIASGQSPATTSAPSSAPKADVYILTPTGWKTLQPTLSTYNVTRVGGSACAGSRCLVVGTVLEGSAWHAVVLWTPTTGTPSFTALATTGAALTTIACPSTTVCYATGWKVTGAAEIVSDTHVQTSVTRAVDTLPSLTGHAVAQITRLVCAKSLICYATATFKTTAKERILWASPGGTSPGTWTAATATSTLTITSLNRLSCASTLASTKPVCYVSVGGTQSGRRTTTVKTAVSVELSVDATKTTTWQKDTTGLTPKTLTDITCPRATKCYEVGTYTSGGSVKGFAMSSTGSTTWTANTVSTSAITALTTVTCVPTTSSVKCYAIGTTSTGPVIVSYPGSGTTWTTDTFPASYPVTNLEQIICTSTTRCIADGTRSGAAGAALLTTTGTSWSAISVTGAEFLYGIGCAGATCTGAGASETSALFMNGAPSATAWSNATPSGLTGLYLSNVPISVSATALKTTDPYTEVPATSSRDPSSIGPLFPFTSGYTVAAAGCASDVSAGVAATSKPGAANTGMSGRAQAPSVGLPMGLLPVEVVNASGIPQSGATISATLVSCTTTISYALEPTGGLGLSETAVMYGDYAVTATANGRSTTKYVEVTPTVVELYASSARTTFSTLPLPTPVVMVT